VPRAAANYAVFFRNVNLGRPGKPGKAQLEAAFAAAGGLHAQSFLATGNVVFAAPGEAAARRVLARACAALEAACGLAEPAFLRPLEHLARLAAAAPFEAVRADDVHEYGVTFLAAPPAALPALPLRSARGDLEVFRIAGVEAFGFTRLVDGRPGNVNGLLEKRLQMPATTRSWNTVRRLVERRG